MRILITISVVSAYLLVADGAVWAQHHHHGHHGHVAGHAHVHHRTSFGHSGWSHVVPHQSTYVGVYYSTGSSHYYSPPRVVPVMTPRNNVAGPSAFVAAPQPVELTFDGFGRYQDLAGRLDAAANAFCLDMHYNYRQNLRFAQVYSEAYGLLQAARYIHGSEHAGDREAIRRRIAEVDGLFHHVQGEISGWAREPTKQVGPDTLAEKSAAVEAILHHLCFDVGVNPHEQPTEIAPPPAAEILPPPRG